MKIVIPVGFQLNKSADGIIFEQTYKSEEERNKGKTILWRGHQNPKALSVYVSGKNVYLKNHFISYFSKKSICILFVRINSNRYDYY